MRDRIEADNIVQGAYNRALLDLILAPMRVAAKELGFALAVHGSLNRDVDLIAVPWVEKDVATPDDLLTALIGVCKGVVGRANCHDKEWVIKPHNRLAKVIMVYVGENTAHLDLSVMIPQS